MLKKIVPFMVWLIMLAIIAPLFQSIEKDDSLSFPWVDEGVSQQIKHDTQTNLFSLKLLKKAKSAAIVPNNLVSGKSRCRPVSQNTLKGIHSIDRPLFLIYHSLRFYDIS